MLIVPGYSLRFNNMEFFEKFVDVLRNIFNEFPWLFLVFIGLFFVLTIVGLIVQSSYKEDYHVDK